MAIDFPASPTDGQIYQGYRWSLSKGAWLSSNPAAGSVITSATTPTGASAGDMWFNTVDGTLFIYYNDGISTNWVEVNSTSSLLGQELKTTKANLSGGNSFDGTQTVNGTVNASYIQMGGSTLHKFVPVVSYGALATNYAFTLTEKSACTFVFSATGYSNAQVLRNWTLVVNGSNLATAKQFFNSTSFHLPSIPGYGSVTLNAGTYNASVSYDGSYDSNDFCTILCYAKPTA